jgi:hypothetical protein
MFDHSEYLSFFSMSCSPALEYRTFQAGHGDSEREMLKFEREW